jgi:hypothetical protein
LTLLAGGVDDAGTDQAGFARRGMLLLLAVALSLAMPVASAAPRDPARSMDRNVSIRLPCSRNRQVQHDTQRRSVPCNCRRYMAPDRPLSLDRYHPAYGDAGVRSQPGARIPLALRTRPVQAAAAADGTARWTAGP